MFRTDNVQIMKSRSDKAGDIMRRIPSFLIVGMIGGSLMLLSPLIARVLEYMANQVSRYFAG